MAKKIRRGADGHTINRDGKTIALEVEHREYGDRIRSKKRNRQEKLDKARSKRRRHAQLAKESRRQNR